MAELVPVSPGVPMVWGLPGQGMLCGGGCPHASVSLGRRRSLPPSDGAGMWDRTSMPRMGCAGNAAVVVLLLPFFLFY